MQSKYEVMGIVGEGAYGIVYKCRNKENGEYVAIKKFKETEDEIVKKTMSRELRALQNLKHENIVEYKEAFKRKGNLYLVFEYVERNLLELLQENPKGLDPNLIKKVIFQLCISIRYLHSLNVIHRDIKPENLLIDSQYKLKLCDFGFARTIKNQKEKLTDYVATRWYRAPELLTGSGTYGPEVDYWAIGCIMGELTDGDPLFPGENEIDQIRVIQKVIGKLADDQNELIAKNPRFKGTNFEVSKPETLERRYMGKLSKTAINFMKALLHPDPKLRLKDDKIFSHPYLENLSSIEDKREITLPSTNKINSISQSVPKKISINNHEEKSNTTTQRDIKEIKNDKDKDKDKDRDSKETSVGKKVSSQMITNTTNINIINYNHFDKDKEDKEKKTEANITPKNALLKTITNFEEKKFKQEKKSNEKKDLILTSTSFNKTNIKDNLNSIYGKTNLDGNFKTFYKGEKYNYDIDLNFAAKKSTSPDEDDKKGREKFGLTKNTFGNMSNIYKDSDYFDNKHGQGNNNHVSYGNKIGKKKIIEKKFKASNVIIEETYNNINNHNHNITASKLPSPSKFDPHKLTNLNYNYKQNYNIQLPTIGGKGYNFNFKKMK